MPRPMYVAFSAAGIVVAVGFCAWFVIVGRFHLMDLIAAATRDSPASAMPTARGKVPPQVPEAQPKFDVVRLDPEGASVFAGSAGPNQRVTILIDGREFASAIADDDGQWAVVVERPIPAGQVEIALIATGPEQGRTVRGQVVRMTVAAPAAPKVASRAVPEARAHMIAQPLAPQPAQPPLASKPEADAKQALRRFEEFVDRARTAAAEVPAAPPVQAPVPVPITFVTDEAVMTPEGTRAAHLLADYLRITKSQAIALTGHADNRGPEDYNMELSRKRLVAIEQFLRAAGYQGDLMLLPKGKTVPYTSVDRSKLTREQVYQLDRRVELQIAGLRR